MNNTDDSNRETSITLTMQDQSCALVIGGDLRQIEVIREFWQASIEAINSNPPALWINFTTVDFADTKLAACIIAIMKRAYEVGVQVYIIGSKAVSEILQLCKFPPLEQITKVA
ncbi:MAG: STAS domain-containing protein [Phycisphaerales bacterium]|nr:STAS domain-containing protein [Planctomycetota bacterium]MBL6997217.1 STAS domain-containing protein [Phycisphaerales bacterium]